MVHKDIYQALERMRKQKGLSEKAFCEGIISERTYRRYLYQESEIPFFVLSELAHRLDVDVFEFLFDVNQYIDQQNFDEIKLLDLLITDQFDEANAFLKTIHKPFTSSASQFLLPLMLLRLEVINGQRDEGQVDLMMRETLNLKALLNMSFITVDHVKLIEHLFLKFNEEEMKDVQKLLQRVIAKDILLIIPSDYSLMKCHQLYIHGLILSHATTQDIKQAFINAIRYSYEHGGLMILDELMLLMREHEIDQNDALLRTWMASFYIPAIMLYHLNEIKDQDDDLNYFHALDKEIINELKYLKQEVFK